MDAPERERTTSEVGELIMQHLKGLDTVAYIRFASVYRDFKDVNEFKQELEGLLASHGKEEELKDNICQKQDAQSYADSRRRHWAGSDAGGGAHS